MDQACLVCLTIRTQINYMILFLDTEFTNFTDLDLISFGLVSYDGQHDFYAEITDCNNDNASPFVKEVVWPLLQGPPYAMTRAKAGAALAGWIDSLSQKSIDVVIDYNNDGVLMALLLEGHELSTEQIRYVHVSDHIKQTVLNNSLTGPDPAFLTQEQFDRITALGNELSCGMDTYFNQNSANTIHHALVDANALRRGFIAYCALADEWWGLPWYAPAGVTRGKIEAPT